MQDYEDPRRYIQRHVEQAAGRYTEGLRRSGLQPSARLARAMAERAVLKAKESYIRDITEMHDRRIAAILREHKKRINAIKRKGATLRLMLCLPVAVVLGGFAWYTFYQPNGFFSGIIYAGLALAFLSMLVLGAILDRPIK
jgi:hypothetical protein